MKPAAIEAPEVDGMEFVRWTIDNTGSIIKIKNILLDCVVDARQPAQMKLVLRRRASAGTGERGA